MRAEPWSRRDFERVYAQTDRDLYAYVVRRVGPLDAEDLTAQAFAEAWRHRDRYDPDLGTQRGWIFGIAANLIRRHVRTEGSRVRAMARAADRGAVVGEDDDTVERLDATNHIRVARSAVERLSETDREILTLAAYTSLSMEEIAGIVDMPVGTLKSRLSRARGWLREEMGAG